MIEVKFPNPQAALICSNAVDVADIGVVLGKYPCLVLVTAVDARPLIMTSFNTAECKHAAEMAFSLGLVTEEQAKIEGKIIGSFFAEPLLEEDYSSPWAYGYNPATLCRVVSPIFLDTPQNPLKRLTFSEARTGFSVIHPAVTVTGEELILPVKQETFRKAVEGADFMIPLTERFAWQLFANDSLEQYKVLTLYCCGYSKSFAFDPDNAIVFKTDKENRQVKVFSAMQGREISLPYFRFYLKQQLF